MNAIRRLSAFILWLDSEGKGYGSVEGDWLAEGAAEMDGPLTSESIPCRPARARLSLSLVPPLATK